MQGLGSLGFRFQALWPRVDCLAVRLRGAYGRLFWSPTLLGSSFSTTILKPKGRTWDPRLTNP